MEVDAISSIIQSFRNHIVEFGPPMITEKPPLFGVDKWLDKQNGQISKRFTSVVRKIESLYMEDAYRRRCLLQASKMVSGNGVKRKR